MSSRIKKIIRKIRNLNIKGFDIIIGVDGKSPHDPKKHYNDFINKK